MQTAPEKRRARRIAHDTVAQIKLPAHGEKVISARTRDLSQNGVFLYLDQKLEPGAALEMVLMLPEELSRQLAAAASAIEGRGWMCCRGTVVRVEDNGVAAKFDTCDYLPEL